MTTATNTEMQAQDEVKPQLASQQEKQAKQENNTNNNALSNNSNASANSDMKQLANAQANQSNAKEKPQQNTNKNNNNNQNRQNFNNRGNNKNGGVKNPNANQKQNNFNQKNNQNKNNNPRIPNGNFNSKNNEAIKDGAFQNGNIPKRENQASTSNLMSSSQNEKKFTGRCRLFVGNLPNDVNEADFKELFVKFGEVGECFVNNQRNFAFVKLDTRINAEHAKQELDGFSYKGRNIRVRFASHGAAVRVKNLSPYVSNEYLEQAFSIFGPVERAVVIVDDKGRPTGEGIVEFERKPAATHCISKCADNYFILTNYPKPVIVEHLEQKDDEDGMPEKSIIKNQQYHTEREVQPHFAPNGSFEQKMAIKWKDLYEFEKQVQEEARKRVEQAREMLEYEIEQSLIDHKAAKLKEDLRAKQEELQRIEDMRKSEYQRRQDMEIRRQEEERRRQDELMRQNSNSNNNNNNVNNNNKSNKDNQLMRQSIYDGSILNQVFVR
jgi:hypothetical protein